LHFDKTINVQFKLFIMKKKLVLILALIAITIGAMAQWMPQNSGLLAASRGIKYMHAVDQNIVWATAYDGSGSGAYIQEFTRTLNGGNLWTPGTIPSTTGLEMSMIYAIDGNTAWAPMYKQTGTSLQGIYKTTDGGVTWARQATAAFNNSASFPNCVHFFNANTGWCMGDPINGDFEMYTTTDGGTTWVLVPGANIADPVSGEFGVVGYYSVVGDQIWFGTNKGRVYHSVDQGHNWTAAATTLTNKYVDVKFRDALHGIVQDKGESSTGAICETSDGGATWAAVTTSGPIYTNDYCYVPGTPNTWVSTGAATDLSGCSYSFDGGHNWTEFNGTSGIQFLATDWVDNAHGWAGAFTDESLLNGMYVFTGVLTNDPAIAVAPASIETTLGLNGTSIEAMEITNTGGADLTWTIAVDPASTSWLTTAPTNGTTAVGLSTPISVLFDAAGLAIGDYTANLLIASNDPANPTVTVPVTLHVADFVAYPPTNLQATVAGVNVHLTWEEPNTGPSGPTDDFEAYDNFAIDFAPWTNVDVDLSETYGMDGTDWLNEYQPQSFIIFNSLATTPALTENLAYSGEKFAACFAATTPPNNDWLISPQTPIVAGDHVTFWAKSYTDQYGLERFKVGVSTTGTAPADFTIITPGTYVEAPVDAWTQYSYDLSAYAGQNVYVGFNCVSDDAFIFMLDDVTIGAVPNAKSTLVNSPLVKGKTMARATVAEPHKVITQDSEKGTRALTGYNVYRDGSVIANNVPDLSYDDNSLAPGTYEYEVTALYDEGESEPAGPVSVTIATPACDPPQNLSTTYQTGMADVPLAWEAPAGPSPWLHWDDGVNNDGIGLTDGGSFVVAARFTPTELANYDGFNLTTMSIFPRGATTQYVLQVATGANAANLVLDQPVTVVIDQWNEFTLTTPVTIDATQELWIGYACNNQPAEEFPAGCDAGPAVDNYGDMISTDGGASWVSLHVAVPEINSNWNIQGFVTNAKGVKTALSPIVKQHIHNANNTFANGNLSKVENSVFQMPSDDDTRALLGYNVYRNGVKINAATISGLQHTDMGLSSGVYEYYVTAVYDACESEASNTILVDVVNGINDPSAQSVVVYPNPASDYVMVKTNENIVSVKVMNYNGQTVYNALVNGNELRLSTKNLKSGLYLIQLETKSGYITRSVSIR